MSSPAFSPAIPPGPTVFLSHSSADSTFVVQVAGHLARSFSRVFCYEDYQKTPDYVAQMQMELDACGVFVFFVGSGTAGSVWQREEHSLAVSKMKVRLPVLLPDAAGNAAAIPSYAGFSSNNLAVRPPSTDPAAALLTAREICEKSGARWLGKDGLPAEPNLFQYEKTIIDFYQKLLPKANDLGEPEMADDRDKILKGCPMAWPQVARRSDEARIENPLLSRVGKPREEDRYVMVSSLYREEGTRPGLLGFPEAGPRQKLCFPSDEDDELRVAVMVVGGIAPGINAVIDGIVQRHTLYAERGGYAEKLKIYGLVNGVHALDDLQNAHRLLITDPRPHDLRQRLVPTSPHAHEGGSILGTCRDDDLMKEPDRDGKLRGIVQQLRHFKVRILYVIGGDGGMRLARAIQCYAQAESGTELSVVGIPKTMDNDILWVWQSFGFMSAVEKAREVVEHIHTEVTSNPRLGIVQLFGSVSGFVVSHAVLAGSTPSCYLALVPEVRFSLRTVAADLKKRINRRLGDSGGIPGGLVVMAETALPEDALEILEELERPPVNGGPAPDPVLTARERKVVEEFRVMQQHEKIMTGQTPDELRTACLKIVSRGLEYLLKKDAANGSRWRKLRVVANEPRHIIRAIPPSCQDIITGRRLGSLAVDNAMAGYTDFMISQWLTEFVLVPLPLVVLGRKQIHKGGIFWKSVLAKTGSLDCFPEEKGAEE